MKLPRCAGDQSWNGGIGKHGMKEWGIGTKESYNNAFDLY